MGSSANRNRINWQTLGGTVAAKSEKNVFDVFDLLFKGTDFEIEKHPKDLKKIYSEKEILDAKTLSQIYNPPANGSYLFGYKNHGISPDFAIKNTKTGKTLFGEIKKQDGWTGKCTCKTPNKHQLLCGANPSAGRGNAHERMCKLFTPGILTRMKKIGGLKSKLPFWVIMTGPVTIDPKRNRELAVWFEGNAEHFFMWRNQKDGTDLVNHFKKHFEKLF